MAKISTTKPTIVVMKLSWWDRFLLWFATSPLGTALRVGVGSAAAWILDNVASFSKDPVVTTVIIAVVSALLRALNPKDPAYGRKN